MAAIARERTASVQARTGEDGALTILVSGRLDAVAAGHLWARAIEVLERTDVQRAVVDASALEYCDGSGVALLVELRGRQLARGGQWELRGLAAPFQQLFDLLDPGPAAQMPREEARRLNLVEEVGIKGSSAGRLFVEEIHFVGELCAALFRAFRRPGKVRWKDAWLFAEKVGANALPIVSLVAFLMGLIMAFQAAIIVRAFGVAIYIPNMLAKSLTRELGPLVTAVLLAGRTGSTFAAEIGTMKVNEEVDALVTMGLDPVRFLVVTRVLAAVAVMPLLTMFFNVMGLVGGAVVSSSIGIPLLTYMDRAIGAIGLGDLFGGLGKSLVLAFLVAAVGCLNGLRTGPGASAVGDSATRAVVEGLVLIVVADGLFAVIFYAVGI